MPAPGSAPTRLGFLTTGPFDPADPAVGLEEALRLVELGDALGLDTAWLRPDHLRHAISSPVAMLAAASQRTRRIALGTSPVGLRVVLPDHAVSTPAPCPPSGNSYDDNSNGRHNTWQTSS
ncbi:LLM class flavin-dependent oxidoreductase, partial [Clavibacter michiganensis]|uniref:LLM class flavin-dependent oxidoreductase n=1 Tax=Clavibacter michiganensis TaxID=28447 RepID=UPI001F4DACB4